MHQSLFSLLGSHSEYNVLSCFPWGAYILSPMTVLFRSQMKSVLSLAKTLPFLLNAPHTSPLVHSVRTLQSSSKWHSQICLKIYTKSFLVSSWHTFQNSSCLQNCVNLCDLTSMSKITWFSRVKRKPHQEWSASLSSSRGTLGNLKSFTASWSLY